MHTHTHCMAKFFLGGRNTELLTLDRQSTTNQERVPLASSLVNQWVHQGICLGKVGQRHWITPETGLLGKPPGMDAGGIQTWVLCKNRMAFNCRAISPVPAATSYPVFPIHICEALVHILQLKCKSKSIGIINIEKMAFPLKLECSLVYLFTRQFDTYSPQKNDIHLI